MTIVAGLTTCAGFAVTTGVTVATCTADPLPTRVLVTTGVKLPALVGLVVNVTVSEVALAVVTLPTAPPLKTTVLLPGVAEKPTPLMMILLTFAGSTAELMVTTGVTVAICTAAP